MRQGEAIDCSILIVSWNNCDLLRSALEACTEALGGLRAETIVIDNASVDGSAQMVRAGFPEVTVVENDTNSGFAAANNQGIRMARGRHVLLLNNDAIPRPGSFAELFRFLEAHPEVGMVGPRLLNDDGSLQPSTYPPLSVGRQFIQVTGLHRLFPKRWSGRLLLGGYFDHEQCIPVSRLTGACVLVRKESIDAVGLLDEDFHFYGEVHDWCLRMWAGGWQVWFNPAGEVVHVGQQSSGQRWGWLQRRWRVLEATHILLRKHMSRLRLWLWYLLRSFSSLVNRCRLFGQGKRKSREASLARFDFSWYSARLGLGRARNAVRTLTRGWPPLQILFLLRLGRGWHPGLRAVVGAWREAKAVDKLIRRTWQEQVGPLTSAGMMELSCGRLLYAFVRLSCPEVVVETGVANGASTTYILHALNANGGGELHSLDLPTTSDGKTFVVAGKKPGWLVPKPLHGMWSLTLGDTRHHLAPMLEGISTPQIFIHDSEHTYETMLFEYELGWDVLAEGGWLLSDDVEMNRAFDEWTSEHECPSRVWMGRLGFARKV